MICVWCAAAVDVECLSIPAEDGISVGVVHVTVVVTVVVVSQITGVILALMLGDATLAMDTMDDTLTGIGAPIATSLWIVGVGVAEVDTSLETLGAVDTMMIFGRSPVAGLGCCWGAHP